jgi:sulfoxide reductase heme-binding subunit YedZ
MILPWRDRHGRFLPLKAAVLVAVFVPGIVLSFWWANGELGGRPVTEVIHGSGDWAIRFLLISLAITPAARVLSWPRLLLVRRMVGLTALAYALAHLLLYVVNEKWRLGVVASEIVLRFYLTIGFVVLLGLVALGTTSTDAWMRRLGHWWKRMHRALYVLGVMALLHYFIQSKSNVSEPVYFSGLFVWLMLWRSLPMAWQRKEWVLAVLAVVAALASAGIEFAWYALATGINPWRVLAASETLRFGLRPAQYVVLTGLGVALLASARRAAGSQWLRSIIVRRSGLSRLDAQKQRP